MREKESEREREHARERARENTIGEYLYVGVYTQAEAFFAEDITVKGNSTTKLQHTTSPETINTQLQKDESVENTENTENATSTHLVIRARQA